MKKVINLVLAVLVTGCINAQWTYKTYNNGFDKPYKMATTPLNNDAYAYMLNVDSSVVLAIGGGYYCDDNPIVDVIFVINGEDVRFKFEGYKGQTSDVVYITWDMESEIGLVNAFKSASVMKVRINESYCESETYIYKMTSSRAAYDYIVKP
jgi:hypothetical protein